MRISIFTGLASCLILSLASVPASAAVLSYVCPAADGLAEVTLAYDGGDSGALTVGGALGEMKLDATKVESENSVGGETFKTLAIRARGPATAPMPDKGKMEACLAGKGATPDDPDTFAYHVNSCRLGIKAGAPVEIDAEFTLTAIDSPDAEVFVSRSYREESAAPGGRLTIDLFPLLNCPAAPAP